MKLEFYLSFWLKQHNNYPDFNFLVFVVVGITKLCPTLCDPMDCSPPGSFVHGILQARKLEGFTHALLQEIFPTQGSNPCLYISCIGRWALYHWHHLGSPSGKLPKLKDASERAGEPTELGMIKLHFKQLCTSRFQPEESSYWYFGGLLGILVAQW